MFYAPYLVLIIMLHSGWRRSARARQTFPQMCPHKMILLQWSRVWIRDWKGFFARRWDCFRIRLTAATTPTHNPNPNPNPNPNANPNPDPNPEASLVGMPWGRRAWKGSRCYAGTSKEVPMAIRTQDRPEKNMHSPTFTHHTYLVLIAIFPP